MIAQRYKTLIEDYLNNAVDADELTARFYDYFYGEDEGLDKELFLILNDIFESLDCYMPGTLPEQETDTRINETTLRKELGEELRRLDGYIKRAEAGVEKNNQDGKAKS
jgi:Bacterial self-protective colicin-like immunity